MLASFHAAGLEVRLRIIEKHAIDEWIYGHTSKRTDTHTQLQADNRSIFNHQIWSLCIRIHILFPVPCKITLLNLNTETPHYTAPYHSTLTTLHYTSPHYTDQFHCDPPLLSISIGLGREHERSAERQSHSGHLQVSAQLLRCDSMIMIVSSSSFILSPVKFSFYFYFSYLIAFYPLL